MKYIITILVVLLAYCLNAQIEYVEYTNDFSSDERFDFYFTDESAWKIEDGALELFGQSKYEPPVRSPFNIAIIKNVVVGDFTLEVDLKQTGREYGHRDMCLFFGMRDPSNFYYVHIASVADQNAHNIFVVNDEDRRNIATKTTEGIKWGEDWNKVKVERNVETGAILIFFNDMQHPIMEATDKLFTSGRIGFGSFDDTGRIDNINISGQVAEIPIFFLKQNE